MSSATPTRNASEELVLLGHAHPKRQRGDD
jgi:hypothetical protein